MTASMFTKYGIKQLGFYVKSIEESAKAFSSVFGAGPFVDLGASPSNWLKYRGQDSPLLTRCACGQLGNMQIELIEVVEQCPNVYDDMQHYGLHHICIWVEDYQSAREKMLADGFEIAMELESCIGDMVAYFDCRDEFGCFVEINEPMPDMWEGIRLIAENWEGSESLLPMSALMG